MHALFVILLAGLGSVPPAASPAAGVQPISRVREMALAVPGTHVVVVGTLTRYRSGRTLTVQDQSGGIFVYIEDTVTVMPGDRVEVMGIADVVAGVPCIDKATYRKVGSGPPLQPIAVLVEELALGHHDADLVSVEGTLQRIEIGRYEYGLVARAGTVEFTSWVLRDAVGSAASIPPGSEVRVTGVASMKAENGKPAGFEILMRTGGDAVVLGAPPWWTAKRLSRAAVTLGGVVALLFSYVLLLRRQVERQTAVIRERLRTETELKEQYRQAQKMEAVGRLAGGIAHDFNNIMTVVLGYSEVLALELKDNPDQAASISEIQRAAERAARLTRQLLAFGRRQKLDVSVVDLNVVVSDMTTLFGRVLGGDIQVDAEPANGPVTIMTDRAQLEQALLNLAVNARDAMPEGGTLRVSVASRQDGAGRMVGVLSVADTGSGIPADAQPHIFEPFFTTKDVGQGSGLGLAMVYGFVQQAGGTIHFSTAVGQGTTFELSFPLAPQAGPSTDA